MSENLAFANKGGAKWWRVWKRGAGSGLGVKFGQHEGRQVLEGLEKRRRIRLGSQVLATRGAPSVAKGLEKKRRIKPGSKVLATRGAPSAGVFGKEAQNQARE